MNRYQEALNNLVKSSCPQKTICRECDIKAICNSEAKDWIDTIQELVDHVTPKKPIERHYEEEGEQPYIKTTCPNGCRITLSKNRNKFCPECGQAIDWSNI